MSTQAEQHTRRIESEDAKRLRAQKAGRQLDELGALVAERTAAYLVLMRTKRRENDLEATLNMVDRIVAIDDVLQDLRHKIGAGTRAADKLAKIADNARSDVNG